MVYFLGGEFKKESLVKVMKPLRNADDASFVKKAFSVICF